jgi:hypothetical protein
LLLLPIIMIQNHLFWFISCKHYDFEILILWGISFTTALNLYHFLFCYDLSSFFIILSITIMNTYRIRMLNNLLSLGPRDEAVLFICFAFFLVLKNLPTSSPSNVYVLFSLFCSFLYNICFVISWAMDGRIFLISLFIKNKIWIL